MIVFKYTKKDGAEFISHLDTLRHIVKTIIRANLDVKYSNGFNPHMQIFMSAPIGVGIVSECEFCCLDIDYDSEEFVNKFNEKSPKGIKCVKAWSVQKKVNVASIITSAYYTLRGVNKFDVNEVLNSNSFTVTDKNGVQKESRDKIRELYFNGDDLVCRLSYGNNNLRADRFLNELISKYGGEVDEVIKTDVRVLDNQLIDGVL